MPVRSYQPSDDERMGGSRTANNEQSRQPASPSPWPSHLCFALLRFRVACVEEEGSWPSKAAKPPSRRTSPGFRPGLLWPRPAIPFSCCSAALLLRLACLTAKRPLLGSPIFGLGDATHPCLARAGIIHLAARSFVRRPRSSCTPDVLESPGP